MENSAYSSCVHCGVWGIAWSGLELPGTVGGGWNWMIMKVPPNPNHSVILVLSTNIHCKCWI